MVNKYENDNKRMLILVIIFVVVELTNILLMGSQLNILLSVPQIICVLYLMVKGEIKNACLAHIVFTLLSFNATSALDNELILYSYAKIKLLGPLTFSYIIGGFLWLIVVTQRSITVSKNTIFFQCYKCIKYILFSGVAIGLLGVAVFNYSLKNFIDPLVYILNVYIYCAIFVRLYDRSFLKKCYDIVIGLLIASPIVTFISFFLLGVRAEYSEFDALIINEIYRFSPCLLLLLAEKFKHKALILLSMLCYFSNTFVAGRGTDYLIIFIVILSYLYILNFTSRGKTYSHYKFIKFVLLPSSLIIMGFVASYLLTSEGMAGNKIRQFVSLVNIFSISDLDANGMETIGRSPFIRVAEFANIIYEGIQQPHFGLLGKGYGGTYMDSLNLLGGVNLTLGGFSEEIVASGRFPNAHFALPNILLYNGLIGMVYIMRIAWLYIRKIPISPLAISGIIFFLFNFYFNPLLGITSIFILFSTEYNMNIALNKTYIRDKNMSDIS